ncbi:MAG: ECF-type sigma factor [Planctomycetota bacterium]|jgi:RNA polymerase sigma factor (TIGR02999 family)
MSEVTRILTAIEQGDAKAADELLPLVYEQLRRLAARKMSQEPLGQTLQATALVHEAYIRLVGSEDQAMRRILIDNARRKQRLKRGGDQQRVALEDAQVAIEGPSEDVLALDEALTKLAIEDPIKADLVKLRYFAGLTVEQAAQMLGISKATADRYWSYARAWLFEEINRSG